MRRVYYDGQTKGRNDVKTVSEGVCRESKDPTNFLRWNAYLDG